MKNSVSFTFSGSGFDASLMKNILKKEIPDLTFKTEYTDKFNGRFFVSHSDPNKDVYSIVKKYASHVVQETKTL